MSEVPLQGVGSRETNLGRARMEFHPGDNMRANGTSQKWTLLKMLPESGRTPRKLTKKMPARWADREVNVAGHRLLVEPRRPADLLQPVEHPLHLCVCVCVCE